MALTDTAEYWNDVKNNYPYTGPNYFHVTGFECGHRHMFIAKKLGDVNCRGCLKLIEQGNDPKLPPGKTLSTGEKKHLAWEKQQEELYGRCECGSLRTIRMNKLTSKKFLACQSYPKCKKTTNLP
jgi:ssDNA-binding Zn-finger/Zn-ribbon topoisomerase 1